MRTACNNSELCRSVRSTTKCRKSSHKQIEVWVKALATNSWCFFFFFLLSMCLSVSQLRPSNWCHPNLCYTELQLLYTRMEKCHYSKGLCQILSYAIRVNVYCFIDLPEHSWTIYINSNFPGYSGNLVQGGGLISISHPCNALYTQPSCLLTWTRPQLVSIAVFIWV